MAIRCHPFLLAVALSLLTWPAAAQTCESTDGVPDASREDRARAYFQEAVAIETSKPEEALERLRCAETLVTRPAIELRIAAISERLGRLEEAVVAYRRYLELAGDAAPDREALRARIDELQARMAAARADTAKPTVQPIDLMLPGVVLGVTGVVIAGVGAGLVGWAKAQNDEVHDLTGVPWDSDEARGKFEAADTTQSVGIAGLTIGGAAAIAGAAMVVTALLSPASPDGARLEVRLSPRGLWLIGKF